MQADGTDGIAVLHVRGHLDQVENGYVAGWAFMPAKPEVRVTVHLIIDGVTAADGTADAYRSDLWDHGIGDGCCAFLIALPDHVLDDDEHEVAAMVGGQPLVSKERCFRLDKRGSRHQRRAELLFDPSHYLAEVEQARLGPVIDPADHYRRVGWHRRLSPHPLFDARRYAERQGLRPDVDALKHFLAAGQQGNSSAHALFDVAPAISAEKRGWMGQAEPLRTAEHAIFTYLERRLAGEPSPFFSDGDYAQRHPGITEAGFLPLLHYLAFGWREGRRPHREFDPTIFARLAQLDEDIEPYGIFVDWLKDRELSPRPTAPRVSVIVLNHGKALLTLQCLYFLERHTHLSAVEVILVDNGSCDEDFAMLCRWARGVEIVRVGANRGFGEGNNIGVEHARGDLLVFLNNDCFVTAGWLPPLLAAMEDEGVGAAGPKFLFPDGRLQEAGATLSGCGTAVQRGRNLDPTLALFNRTETVDYCSAALLMVRADAFRTVLGFDLRWDPAYYEDSDLCLKLRTIGLRTVYAHGSEAVHLEHATSADSAVTAPLGNIVAVNRLKFLGRWSQQLLPDFRSDPAVVRAVLRPGQPAGSADAAGSLALYTPYPLTPGGGERYLLTIAATYGRGRRCVLFTPDRYSRIRILTLARDLDLNLDHVEAATFDEAGRHERFDLFVCMGNEVLPPVAGIGERNLFHCQFPFPLAPGQHGPRWRYLDGYDSVVVNSAFTAVHYSDGLQRLGLAAKLVVVVPPPVPQQDVDRAGHDDAPRRILSVGRFTPGGHCKRQDAMIEVFRELRKNVAQPVELHLAGAIGAERHDREYFEALVAAACGVPVRLHANPGAAEIAALYRSCDLYWHMTGLGRDIGRTPELFEHFGIALVEAMSAGLVPVALRGAGPSEIITDGADGVLVADAAELVTRSAELLAAPVDRARMGAAATRRAADYTPELFAARFTQTIGEITGEAAALAQAAQ